VQESGQVQRSLQNCGFSDKTCVMTPLWGPEFGVGFWILGKFLGGSLELFHGAVLLLRVRFSDSNVAQLLLKPRSVPIDEVKQAWILCMRLVSTFIVGHFAYGDSRERRREFDAPYSGKRYVGLDLLTMNILNVSELNTNTRCSLVRFSSSL
jgi:hypothetical protein